MSKVINLFADTNNVVDFTTRQPIRQTENNNVDFSLAARRAERAGSAEMTNDNVLDLFFPFCA
jgi:hypothetical protein